jgi:hypothetical protein
MCIKLVVTTIFWQNCNFCNVGKQLVIKLNCQKLVQRAMIWKTFITFQDVAEKDQLFSYILDGFRRCY